MQRVPPPLLPKYFNTAGPCLPGKHYLLPPVARLPEARTLVEKGGYFVLHAARQSGKTTILLELARELTASGQFAALYVSVEAGEANQDDFLGAQELIISRMLSRAESQLPEELRPPRPSGSSSQTLLGDFLSAWCQACPRPVVVLFDEIDALRGQSLIAVLRQLRDAFPLRPERAPWSVVLCGLRDVREYKAASGGDTSRLGTASPFNIKVESLTLSTFTEAEVAALL